MAATIPTLTGTMIIRDSRSIILFQLRRYFKTPKEAMPFLDGAIISLNYQLVRFSQEIDKLTANIQADLQSVFNRIFTKDRPVTVSVVSTPDGNDGVTIIISVTYTSANGDVNQVGANLSLDNKGSVIIPEDSLQALRL